MSWDLVFWVLVFFLNFALLASTFYQLLCLSDLEADYINPYDTSSRINALVVPEMVVQAVICVLFLLTWHWFMFLITLPLACYHVMLYTKRQHLIDVTEVFRFLNGEKKYRMIKLGFYLLFFLIIIFRLMLSIFNALTEEDAHVW